MISLEPVNLRPTFHSSYILANIMALIVHVVPGRNFSLAWLYSSRRGRAIDVTTYQGHGSFKLGLRGSRRSGLFLNSALHKCVKDGTCYPSSSSALMSPRIRRWMQVHPYSSSRCGPSSPFSRVCFSVRTRPMRWPVVSLVTRASVSDPFLLSFRCELCAATGGL